MKITTFFAGFLLIFSSFLFTRCTADRDFVSTPREILSQGSWSVASLSTGGAPTSQFAGYTLSFGSGNTVIVSGSDEPVSGSWQWKHNVQNEVLDLQLPDHSALKALNSQWTLEQWGLHTLTLKRGADVLVLNQLSVR